jgi:hypothetical protein
LSWSPRVRGVRRAPVLFAWLEDQQPAGTGFGAALAAALARLAHQGLLVLVSDWWDDNMTADLKALGMLHQEIVAVHVVSPQELDPAEFGTGAFRLVDSESGHEIELTVDHTVLAHYRTDFAAWQDRLRQVITSQQGRYLQVRSDCNLDRLLLHDWRKLGLIS